MLKIKSLKCGVLLRWSSDDGTNISDWILLEERKTNHHTTRNFRMLCVYTNKLYGISPGDHSNYEFNLFNIDNYTLLSNVP